MDSLWQKTERQDLRPAVLAYGITRVDAFEGYRRMFRFTPRGGNGFFALMCKIFGKVVEISGNWVYNELNYKMGRINA